MKTPIIAILSTSIAVADAAVHVALSVHAPAGEYYFAWGAMVLGTGLDGTVGDGSNHGIYMGLGDEWAGEPDAPATAPINESAMQTQGVALCGDGSNVNNIGTSTGPTATIETTVFPGPQSISKAGKITITEEGDISLCFQADNFSETDRQVIVSSALVLIPV